MSDHVATDKEIADFVRQTLPRGTRLVAYAGGNGFISSDGAGINGQPSIRIRPDPVKVEGLEDILAGVKCVNHPNSTGVALTTSPIATGAATFPGGCGKPECDDPVRCASAAYYDVWIDYAADDQVAAHTRLFGDSCAEVPS